MDEVIGEIKRVLIDGPLSVNEVADKAGIYWRTADTNLKLLVKLNVVQQVSSGYANRYILKDSNNFFQLPIKEKDQKFIMSIYSVIKKICLELFNQEPTKTQAYKIIWKVNEKEKLGLPIGWYRYGPCCVQVYKGDEQGTVERKLYLTIKNVTKEFCSCDNFELQKKIYKEENKRLYIAKEEFLKCSPRDKDQINNALMDIVKHCQKEAVEVATDFARATLLLGIEKTRDVFDIVWKYLTMIEFRDSLKSYYKNPEYYFDNKIASYKKEAQLLINDLVTCHFKETRGK
jgi:hypothetical protein